jgi:hypothetical protein
MAVAGQSTSHHDAVGPLLESLQHVHGIQFAGAGQPYYLEVRRVLDTERTGKVCCCIGAVVAAEGHDLWFEVVHLSFSGVLRLEGEECLFLRHHLLISIVHQLNRLGWTLGRTGTAALASSHLYARRALYPTCSNK